MQQKFNLGETVYQITYCSYYSDRGHNYRKTYIKKICTIQELGEEDRTEYITAIEESNDKFMSYLDIVKTESEALKIIEKLKGGAK